MKFTWSWLQEHLETTQPMDAIVEKLSLIGLEVEGVEDKAKALAPFIVADIISAEKHPMRTSCGCAWWIPAPAVRCRWCAARPMPAPASRWCSPPPARSSATGTELKIGTIRGVESRGMLCSARELGLSEEHDGILELPEDAPVGAPFAQVLGLNDPVIEIAVTPNRADCLGVAGVARDLAAAGLGELMAPRIAPVEGTFRHRSASRLISARPRLSARCSRCAWCAA